MTDFIKKLHDQTENLKISITNGYPRCIGIRSVDPIITDDIVNLIYGNLTYRADMSTYKFHNIDEIDEVDEVDNIFMDLRIGSQVIIYGHIIQIDLGDYYIDKRYHDGDDRIIMEIHRKN